jgi:hypothetical protein
MSENERQSDTRHVARFLKPTPELDGWLRSAALHSSKPVTGSIVEDESLRPAPSRAELRASLAALLTAHDGVRRER